MRNRFAIPGRVWHRVFLASALVFASIWFSSSSVRANPRELPVTTIPGNSIRLQPPSFRLKGMGNLMLSVRDEYTEINLWDYSGVTAGAGIDRDSTSVDLWVQGEKLVNDIEVPEDDLTVETFRSQGTALAGEGVIRFSETLSLGADAGVLSIENALPYSDDVSQSLNLTFPAAVLFGSGRLTGPVLWGLSGLFASESFTRKWWNNKLDGNTVKIGQRGSRVDAPNFFTPDQGYVEVLGLGGSAAYWKPDLLTASFSLNYRSEDVTWNQDGTRFLYSTYEPREIWTYGFSVITDALDWAELGIKAGFEDFNSTQNYRFTLSGGSTEAAFVGRGNRLENDRQSRYFNTRFLADIPNTKLTIGGFYDVTFDGLTQDPVLETPNDFNNFVLTNVTPDTLAAPLLVKNSVDDNRIIAFGGGASYKLRDESVILGAEYSWYRNARSGLELDTRPQGWELRLGGEWAINQRWTVRTGWQHLDDDEDRLTLLNEYIRNRWTLGGRWSAASGWKVDGFAAIDWVVTSYEDPSGRAGNGGELAIFTTKEF